jgi:hypothetical protein
MMASLYTVILLAQSAVGGLLHHAPRPGCCDVCGVEKAVIAAEIGRLQTCPFWKDRDRAAIGLRHHAWECHPEIVVALANAMLHDCHEEVREEAAESLTKLAPCMGIAHQALAIAATADPDHATRHWAKRGLAKLNRRCEGACVVCAPGALAAPQAPVSEPFLAPSTPVLPSTEIWIEPPAELPGTVPGTSPFSSAAAKPAKPPGRPQGILGRTNVGMLLFGRPERGDRERRPY